MASDRAHLATPDRAFGARLPGARPALLLVLPFLLASVVTLARATSPGPPTALGLTGGVGAATPEQLTDTAAAVIEAALAEGGTGITFEIIQTSTITARDGGPLVDIPDPDDRTRSLGQAEAYALGTLIERGTATPYGFWSELLHGPDPGAEASFELGKATASRQALVRDGVAYRDDGEGWYETDQLPGIGLDPVTVGLLPSLLTGASGLKDALVEPAQPAASAPPADPFERATTTLDATDVAARIDGLARLAPAARTLDGSTSAAAIPGIIAVDLVEATELLGPARLAFDDAGRLVALTITARNTNLEVHDLVVKTVIAIGYPDRAPALPKPEPAYVAPTAGEESGS